MLPDVKISTFSGLNTAIKNTDDLLPGASPDALNWITGAAEQNGKYYGDHIELRRGTALLAADAISGTTPVSGLGVGIKKDGTQIPAFSAGQKLYYFDGTNNVEVGVNTLPEAATNDDVSIIPYQNLSGYHLIISSPNSSIYKIVIPSLPSIIDFQSYDLKGSLALNLGRSYLWNRIGKTGQKDLVNLYISYADAANYSQNPPIIPKTKVVLNATDGSTKTFAGSLTLDNAFQNCFGVQIVAPIATPISITGITKASSAVITCANTFASGDIVVITGVSGMTEINDLIGYVVSANGTTATISINSSSFSVYTSGGYIAKCEQFTDDQNGILTSPTGGTGTINYISGAYSVTFYTAPVTGRNLIAAFYEDQSNDTSIAAFLLTAPSNDSDGDFIQQPGFGQMMNILPLAGLFFCMHQFGTYQLILINNSVKPNNIAQIVYRNNVGIPYWRAAYAAGDGIPYLDTLNQAWPKLRILTTDYSISATNPAIIPKSISDQLDLSNYDFSKAVVYEWGDYYLLECKSLTNGVADAANDIMFIYNKKTGIYDRLDYRSNCFANYYGALLAGDSISPNPLILFSGFDDLGFNVNNYWKSAPSFLGAMGTKTLGRCVVKGLIQSSQNIGVYLSFDNGAYVKYTSIDGNGAYVNQGIPQEVGGNTIGSNVVGGGGTVFAFPYELEFNIASDLFNRVAIMFKSEPKVDVNGQQIIGSGVGYVDVHEYEFKDIRFLTRELPANNLQ